MTSASRSLPLTEVLCFDGFDDLDAVAPLEILTAAGFPVTLVRPPGAARTVHSAHGLELTVSSELGDSAELIVVPGGGWRDRSPAGVRALCHSKLPGLLARRYEQGTVLASVCTGAMLLAAAGVLAERPAVTHRVALEDLAAAGARVHAEARVVDDGAVLTSGGVTAGLDLSVHLVERFAGAAAGRAAATRLEYAPVGPVLRTATRAA